MVTHADDVTTRIRQHCVRTLLCHPLLLDRGPHARALADVRRNADWLRSWFNEQLGYRLTVEPGFARLRKRPPPSGATRVVRTRSGTPFDARRYALVCLVLAALEQFEVQTTLSVLAERAKIHSAEVAGLDPLDLDRPAERQAFVDAVRFLVDLGLLRMTDGDDAAFTEGSGDALYDIDVRVRAQLFACQVPPSIAAGPAELDPDHYPDTDSGRSRRSRHRLMRRLCDEPVLYIDELDDDERAYLVSQRHFLIGQVAIGLGLDVEVRREGIAVIDPEGACTDLRFPGNGTIKHAALLLGVRLMDRHTTGQAIVPRQELRADLDFLADQHARYWSKDKLRDSVRLDRLFGDALAVLEELALIRTTIDGVVTRPALARFRAAKVRVPEPSLL